MFRRFKTAVKRHHRQPQDEEPQSQPDSGIVKSSLHPSYQSTGITREVDEAEDSVTISERNHGAPDHWQMAYGKLDEREQNILSTVQPTPDRVGSSNNYESGTNSKTPEISDQLIQTTKRQYETYQKGGLKVLDINIRDVAHRILNSALSFKDVITRVVSFDPTGHASSAWAVVSLGLTIAGNHNELRGAPKSLSAVIGASLSSLGILAFFFGGGLVVSASAVPLLDTAPAVGVVSCGEAVSADVVRVGGRVFEEEENWVAEAADFVDGWADADVVLQVPRVCLYPHLHHP